MVIPYIFVITNGETDGVMLGVFVDRETKRVVRVNGRLLNQALRKTIEDNRIKVYETYDLSAGDMEAIIWNATVDDKKAIWLEAPKLFNPANKTYEHKIFVVMKENDDSTYQGFIVDKCTLRVDNDLQGNYWFGHVVPAELTAKKFNIMEGAEARQMAIMTNVINIHERETNQPLFNVGFGITHSKENYDWFFDVIMNWLPDPSKPVVFLPCGSAEKTREKYGKKMISQGRGHQYLSSITRDPRFEKIIISEPLVLIPYSIEDDPRRPDYDYHPKYLTIPNRSVFIIRLNRWLNYLKKKQPERKFIYYIGPRHHAEILHGANMEYLGQELCYKEIFHVIYEVPIHGSNDYATSAKWFRDAIMDNESGVFQARTRNPKFLSYMNKLEHHPQET